MLTLIKGEQGVESFITFTKRGGGGGQETLRMHHFAEGITGAILTQFQLLLLSTIDRIKQISDFDPTVINLQQPLTPLFRSGFGPVPRRLYFPALQ